MHIPTGLAKIDRIKLKMLEEDVLFRLVQERVPVINDGDRAHLREIAERTARFVEDIDSARDRASITQEALNKEA